MNKLAHRFLKNLNRMGERAPLALPPALLLLSLSYFNDHAPLFWGAASVSVLLTVSIFYRQFRKQKPRRS
jgi:hypothetical protein